MNDQDFRETVERYKAALLRAHRESGGTLGTPLPNGEEAAGGKEAYAPQTADDAGEDDSFERFSAFNSQVGFLRVQSFAGQQTIPVQGAQVVVTHTFREGTRRFALGETDESGVLDSIALPAPPAAYSERPSENRPFALYDIRVTHPDYREEVFRDVPVFPGIKSIQPVRFLADRAGP